MAIYKVYEIRDKLKVGDYIKRNYNDGDWIEGEIYQKTDVKAFVRVKKRNPRYEDKTNQSWECSLKDKDYENNGTIEIINSSNNMNIKEKFILAITKEPQKSFRKAGITNGDDILTDDGEKVFFSWLLNKVYADQFKKEVVDDILKEIEDEK